MLTRLLPTVGAAVTATVALVGASLVAPATAHAAEPYGPSSAVAPITAVGHTMWQTNETVYAMENVAGVLYIGGSFSTMRPPGSALGSNEVAQAYLAAIDAETGELISSWRPTLTGPVYALRVSPNGQRLYVGGNFNSIDSSSGPKIAAFDISTPTAPVLLSKTQFTAKANARVSAIAATDDTVWLGGDFTKIGTTVRTNVAAVAATDGSLLPFTVTLADPTAPWYDSTWVSSLTHVGNRVAVGGMFNTVNGTSLHGLAMVDDATGVLDGTFKAPALQPTSFVTASTASADTLYISGRDDSTDSRARLEGVMALSLSDGSAKFGTDYHRCMGDTLALQLFKGYLMAGTHAHDCSDIGTHPETSPRFYAAALMADATTGQQLNYYPNTAGKSSVPGSLNNIRAFASDGTSVWAGGGWTSWNGVAQQNLVKLTAAQPSEAPAKVTPKASTGSSVPGVTLTWTASTDADNRSLTYTLFRNNSTTPCYTVTRDSAFWSRPQMSYFDSDVVPGQVVTYKLKVSDGANVVVSNPTPKVSVLAAPTSYAAAVTADKPLLYWRLNETAGSTSVADASGNSRTGATRGTVAFGGNGPLTSVPSTSAALNGKSYLSSSSTIAPTAGLTEELWFKTTSTTGGTLAAFGSTSSGSSSQHDRQLYLSNGGQLYFGTYVGYVATVNTTTSYNDGVWHHVVASLGADGQKLYVDGALRASNAAVTSAENFTGYFRAGGENLAGWNAQPASSSVSGSIDEVALYGYALSAAAVSAHYGLR